MLLLKSLRMFKIFQSKDLLLSDIILELDSEDDLLSDISNKLKMKIFSFQI